MESIVSGGINAFATLIGFASGSSQPQQSVAALNSLTTNGTLAFNQRFPQGIPSGCTSGAELVNGVRYFSWTGIQPLTNILDVTDGSLGLLSLLHGAPNDGLVTSCSSRLGRHLGDYGQNHLDEVNQLLGLRNWFATDPVTLYRQHANRLKNLGL